MSAEMDFAFLAPDASGQCAFNMPATHSALLVGLIDDTHDANAAMHDAA